MSRIYDQDELEESYGEWLEEACECKDISECSCLSLEDWLEERVAKYWECFEDEEYA